MEFKIVEGQTQREISGTEVPEIKEETVKFCADPGARRWKRKRLEWKVIEIYDLKRGDIRVSLNPVMGWGDEGLLKEIEKDKGNDYPGVTMWFKLGVMEKIERDRGKKRS